MESFDLSACISESILFEAGGSSDMVISQLMTKLELTINLKINCEAVSDLVLPYFRP